MYNSGRGVPQDDAEAVRWYRLAAEQGYANAQYNIAHMYRNGRAVPQAAAETVRWFRLAAEQGVAAAQLALGVSYATGQGVAQDYVQAHMWANLGASRSTGEDREAAVSLRDLITDALTPDDLSEAQRLAREWDAAHPREP